MLQRTELSKSARERETVWKWTPCFRTLAVKVVVDTVVTAIPKWFSKEVHRLELECESFRLADCMELRRG